MVASKINSDVIYQEKRTIDPEDLRFESSLYEMDVFGKSLVITLGKPKYSFSSKKIIFYPIYIVSKDNKIEAQIGVFEISENKALKVYDDDGDVDIEKLGSPLYYEFAERVTNRTKSDVIDYLQTWEKKGKTDERSVEQIERDLEKESEDQEESDEDDVMKLSSYKQVISSEKKNISKMLEKGIFTIDENTAQPPKLNEETKEQADQIKKEYKESSQNLWIHKFMKNLNYKIHEVENNGDCFFAVIRDAFKQIGHNTTVAKLRAILADEATDEIFKQYSTLYLELDGSIKEYEKEITDIKRTIEKDLKKRAEHAKGNKQELDSILAEVEKQKTIRKDLISKINETNAIIAESIGIMGGIDSLEKFREYVQTTSYWADDWAISTIERKLNIKMIIFSEKSFLEGDEHSVLKCSIGGQIDTNTEFSPNYYIMTTYSGNHYRLITYKNKNILTFSEIPYNVKTLVINKCIEKDAGIYYLIQDFRNLKSRLGIDPDTGKPDEDDESTSDLYKNDTMFMFYHKSEKSAKPGKGSGEKIPKEKMNEFINLARIENWRRKIDDSWDKGIFTIEGHRYASVEHYYQSSKFKKGFPDFSLLFSLDSDSEISKDVSFAKSAGGKTGKHKEKGKETVLRPKEVVIDNDFYGQRNKLERETGVRAKFTQNEDLKQLLLATKDAKLSHYVVKQPPEQDDILMKIRNELHII